MEQTGKGMASRKTYVILAITWIIFLIIYIILGSGVQAFRFSGGSMMTAFIAAGSLAVFIILTTVSFAFSKYSFKCADG